MRKQLEITERGETRYIPRDEDILPSVHHVPAVVDPYAAVMPQTVQNVVHYEATPITRAQAMIMRVNQVTVFLAILTGCLMFILQWYPPEWGFFAVFVMWLALASVEWIGVFCLLAILDYWETPAAQNRQQMGAYLDMMRTEQYHMLRALYPDQFRGEDKKP